MKDQTLFFNLSAPLEFSKKGDFEETLSLEISPPSPKNYDLVMTLAQHITKAMFEAQRTFSDMSVDDEPVEGRTAELDADAVRMMLFSSSIPMSEYIGPLAKLLSMTCTLDGETRITQPIFEKIDISDKNRLLCEYVVNFIAPLTFAPASREG